jgi:hypothetical protein
MKKLLLLDADVIIDLHSLGIFDRICKTYEVYLTKTVLGEASYFKKDGKRHKIDISDRVVVVEDVDLASLKAVQNESKEARIGIDPGELESVSYLNCTKEEILFCTCDRAALKLISFMELEHRSVSLEMALRSTGYHKRNLYPRHWERTFRECIQEGKVLRIQLKKFT